MTFPSGLANGAEGTGSDCAPVCFLQCLSLPYQDLLLHFRAVGKRRWWIPPMVESIIAALGDQDFAGMPQVAAAIYIEVRGTDAGGNGCSKEVLAWFLPSVGLL